MSGIPSASEALIGGFFALEPDGPGGMAAHWGLQSGLAWENAGSAFAALVLHLRPSAVWLPGYLCSHMAQAVPKDLQRFYAITSEMEPDPASLKGLRAGDMVLGVNYFGRAAGLEWQQMRALWPGATFVEDGAQCLDSGQPAWGDWRLFSPRKLFGVPEGGLLVPLSDSARSAGLTGPAKPSDPALSDQRRRPMNLRRKHPQDNALWHPAHQAVEAMGEVSDRAMDPAALALLTSLDPMPMIAARRANFAILAQHLANFAVLPEGAPEFAPFGFPVRLPAQSRGQVLQQLHAQGIFPAVHWRDIVAPLSFAADHARAATLATLPCDHRYGRPEMERVADAFLRALS